MPVSEYGEIGRLVQFSEELDMVILWAVHEVKEFNQHPLYGSGFRYRTSRGWVKGKPEEYFCPKPRERSLRPCILRAVDYAKKNWPDKPAQTH